MKRKSPIKHLVKRHSRDNAPVVRKYERGHGKRPPMPSRSKTVAIPPKKPFRKASVASRRSFKVQVDGESFKINASTFVSALDSGLARGKAAPQHVKITREVRSAG